MSSIRDRMRRRPASRPSTLADVYDHAGTTHPGLPYFSLDKVLEKELDKGPEAASRLPAAAKTRLAIKLRIAGANYDQIAEKLGYASAASVHSVVRSYLAKWYSADEAFVEEVVMADLARLDAMQLVIWEKATRHADDKAVNTVLKIMEKRHELLGIGPAGSQPAATQFNVSFQGGSPNVLVVGGDDELDYVNQLRAARGAEPLKELPADSGSPSANGQVDEEVVDAEVVAG